MCRGKVRELDYNKQAIKPFLCEPIPEYMVKNFYGRGMNAEDDENDEDYLFHVTRLGNFKSIINHGLLCSFGSNGGAGEIMGGGKFRKHERGNLFATSYPAVVDKYIFNYDRLADSRFLSNNLDYVPILLRFKPLDSETWLQDRKEKKAVKGSFNISPERLEFLSFEGWVSLFSLEARRLILNLIDEILESQADA